MLVFTYKQANMQGINTFETQSGFDNSFLLAARFASPVCVSAISRRSFHMLRVGSILRCTFRLPDHGVGFPFPG